MCQNTVISYVSYVYILHIVDLKTGCIEKDWKKGQSNIRFNRVHIRYTFYQGYRQETVTEIWWSNEIGKTTAQKMNPDNTDISTDKPGFETIMIVCKTLTIK